MKNLKIYILGVCLILSGLSTCTVNILTENGKPVDNITQSITEIKKGIDIIKEAELDKKEVERLNTSNE